MVRLGHRSPLTRDTVAMLVMLSNLATVQVPMEEEKVLEGEAMLLVDFTRTDDRELENF